MLQIFSGVLLVYVRGGRHILIVYTEADITLSHSALDMNYCNNV